MKWLAKIPKSAGEWRSFFRGLTNSKPVKSPSRPRCRPTVEILEARRLLSAWQAVGPSPEHSESYSQNVAGLVSSIAFASNYDGKGDAAMYMDIA